MVGSISNDEPFELSKAMKTMIKIQKNRFRTTIDENSSNNDDKIYNSIIKEILDKEVYKMDEVYIDPKIDVELPNKLDDTIMPTMASLSCSSKLKFESNSTKTMATLFVDHAKKQDKNDAKSTMFGDDNILQWLKKNLQDKTTNQFEESKNVKCKNYDDMNVSSCFQQKPNNDDIVSKTTDSTIDEPINCDDSCGSSNTTPCSNHYYGILQCKQRQKHEKCDIHGIDLKMVCAHPKHKLTSNKMKKDIMQGYGISDTIKAKSIKINKLTHAKQKLLSQQNTRITKSMSNEERVFEKYKTLAYAKKAHDHLNEFDSDLLFSNKQRNILAKCHATKVKDKELYKMIDDIMLLDHGNGSKTNTKEAKKRQDDKP